MRRYLCRLFDRLCRKKARGGLFNLIYHEKKTLRIALFACGAFL